MSSIEKNLLKAFCCLTGFLGLAGGAGAVALARQTAFPRTLTLEEEEAYEKEHGLWGDFGSLERIPYTVKGLDGYLLHCEMIPAREASCRYVILTHGYTSNRLGSVKYLSVYRSLGFNCIIYDVRGHGENERTAVSLGQFEAEDLRCLIEDSYVRWGEGIELGLHGESMGSSISLSVLRSVSRLRFVVADCGFSNFYELMKELFAARRIRFLLPAVNRAMKLYCGYDMRKTDPAGALAQSSVPVCLIHGSADGFINPEHSRILSRKAKGYCELHMVEGARHAQSREKIGEEAYGAIVRDFLRNIAFPVDSPQNEAERKSEA